MTKNKSRKPTRSKSVEAVDALYECAECSRRPGTITLCARCLRSRALAGPRWIGQRPSSFGDEPVAMDAVRAHDPRQVTRLSRPAESAPESDEDHGRRLRDTDVGNWLGALNKEPPLVVPPAFVEDGIEKPGRVDVRFQILVPFLATHLAVAIDQRFFPFVRVERFDYARRVYVYDTPVAVFAVRVPEELHRPVDRGGSLGGEIRLFPAPLPSVALTNSGREAAPFDLALFGRMEED